MEKKKDMRFRLFGTAPSRNPTLIATVGMRIRGCGGLNLNGAKNRKERESMGKSRASKMNGYRSIVSRQKNDVFKFKPKKKKKG